MKTLTKKYSLTTLVWMALAVLSSFLSCTKDEGNVADFDRESAIGMSATLQSVMDAKAAVAGTSFPVNTIDVFRLTAFAGVTVPTNWSSAYFDNAQVNSDATGILALTTKQYYPANGNKVYFYGYTPSTPSLTKGTATTPPQANYTITGQEDIMAAQETTGISAITTTSGGVQRQPSLTFAHKLMQLKFKTVRDNSFADGKKVNEIVVKAVRNSAKLNIVTGVLTFDGTADKTFKLPINAGTADELITTAGTKMVGCVMLEPASKILLKVTADGVIYDDIAVTLTGTNAGKAGVSHLITLTFKRTGIAPTATIGEWAAGGQAEIKPILPPAKMIYGGENGTITSSLLGSTRSSYNGFNGLVSANTNGAYYTSTSTLYSAEKVYHNLEVALADEVLANGSTLMTWDEARTACGTKTTYGGGWRLPRFTELLMMYQNRTSLQKVPGFAAFSDGYYSKTENNATHVWIKLFKSGTTSFAVHASSYRARCVREVPAAPAKMYYGDANNNGGITTIITSGGTYALKGSTTASYNNYPTGNYNSNYTNVVTAEKVYYKLEVANAYELNPATGKNSLDWDTAMKFCKAKSTDGGGWRLPRISEMHLIYMNKASLEQTPEFDAFHTSSTASTTGHSMYHSSASEWSDFGNWIINFSDGTTANGGKTGKFSVRCVREL